MNLLVFLALFAGFGATLIIWGALEFAAEGWAGRVPIREHWGLHLTVAEAWALGGIAVSLAGFVAWRSRTAPTVRTASGDR